MTTGQHDHGSLGQEAARLADAVTGWLEANDVAATLRTAARRGASVAGAPVGDDQLPPECGVCPFCQAVRRLRGVRPEVFEHLSVASAALLAAVRTALDGDNSGTTDADPTPDATAPADDSGPPRRRPPDVQRIDIR